MPETVLFESEREHSREEVAEFLRIVADNLEAGEPITLRAGEKTVTMDPPAHPTFEVKAEREGPEGGPHERSVEFELEWDEGEDGTGSGSGELQIE